MTTLQIIRLNESAPAMAHGFRYNVQIWTKDSGHGWCYAGNGKFLKTAGEVLSYGKARGEELEKLEEKIVSLDAVALVSWARVFEAVKTPGVVAHWEVQHEIDGKAYTEQRILHASVKNLGCIQYSTAHIYPDEYIPVMDSQFKNAADFFRYEAPLSAVVIIEKVA